VRDAVSDFQKKFEEEDRQRRKNELFTVKNAGIVLLEIFPVEKKAAMLDGLARLFERKAPLIDDKVEGVLGGGWEQNLGYLVSRDSEPWPDERIVKKDLPAPFSLVEVAFGKHYGFGFCYYLVFTCRIKPDFQTGIEDEYVSEGKPDVYEPRMRSYQEQIESYLAKYVQGIFLSEKTDARLRCPSLRILVANQIEFEKFEDWTRKHFRFLLYLGLISPASRVDCYLITYQPEHLLKEHGIFAGLTFVCSKANYKVVSSDLEVEVLANVSFFFKMRLLAWFIAIYWAVFKLERELPGCEEKITALEVELRQLLTLKKYRVRPIRPVYAKLMMLRNEFAQFSLDEERKITVMKNFLARDKGLKSDQILPVFKIKIDILDDIAQGTRFLDEERDRLTFARRKIASIFDQSKQFTDFALQSSMRTLTIAAVILGILALIASFAKELWYLLSALIALL
jgi:hypothetical protein